MIEHHLQKKIIQKLVETPTARYADLKPANIDGNTFAYHLHAVIRNNLVTKNEDGSYALTSQGKLFGINSSLPKDGHLQQAHSVILLSIRDGDKWLLRERRVQPLFGKVGFVHGEPRSNESIHESAARILKQRTGLTGSFTPRAAGYIKQHEQAEIVAFTHFTLLDVLDLSGELIVDDDHGKNTWFSRPDFSSDDMIPSMPYLAEQLQSTDNFFFCDLEYVL